MHSGQSEDIDSPGHDRGCKGELLGQWAACIAENISGDSQLLLV